uniref:Agamous-like MADS-box protein AGL36 n=1 Tax=Aegilops tauschii TaxID=37682 RepID=M8CUE2_AEGTA
MARKKVPLRYIGNSTQRRTYVTRRNNLVKKAGELGILCNTKICMLVYDEGAAAPDVYPSHTEAVAILNRYKNMPDIARFKKEIRKSLAERIANTSGQPPVFQPQAPYVTGGVDMGPPSTDQGPPQQEGWQPEVFQQAQAPQVTSNVDMGYLPTYQVPPQQQQGWRPQVFRPQAPYVTGNVDMGPPQMYHVPLQQHGWQPPTFQRSEGDGALLYNANNGTGGHDGAGTSSSAGFPMDDLMQFFNNMGSGLQ